MPKTDNDDPFIQTTADSIGTLLGLDLEPTADDLKDLPVLESAANDYDWEPKVKEEGVRDGNVAGVKPIETTARKTPKSPKQRSLLDFTIMLTVEEKAAAVSNEFQGLRDGREERLQKKQREQMKDLERIREKNQKAARVYQAHQRAAQGYEPDSEGKKRKVRDVHDVPTQFGS